MRHVITVEMMRRGEACWSDEELHAAIPPDGIEVTVENVQRALAKYSERDVLWACDRALDVAVRDIMHLSIKDDEMQHLINSLGYAGTALHIARILEDDSGPA